MLGVRVTLPRCTRALAHRRHRRLVLAGRREGRPAGHVPGARAVAGDGADRRTAPGTQSDHRSHGAVASISRREGKVGEAIEQTVALAKYPNVSCKMSSSPTYSLRELPIRRHEAASQTGVRGVRTAALLLGHRHDPLVRQSDLPAAHRPLHRDARFPVGRGQGLGDGPGDRKAPGPGRSATFRVPGASQHEVVRCRPGTVEKAMAVAVATASELDLLLLDHALDRRTLHHPVLERRVVLEFRHRQLAAHAPGVEHEAVRIDHGVAVGEPLPPGKLLVDLLQIPVEGLEAGLLDGRKCDLIGGVTLRPIEVGMRGMYARCEESR